jgi:putative flippase GtrA
MLRHPLVGPGLRFVVAGSTVALVFLGVPYFLNAGAGVPVEVAIPIAYVLALSLHFTLQRLFVFRHIAEFTLTTRAQLKRYGVIASIQYPTTAIVTAFLPSLLHLPQRDTYVIVALTMSVLSFFVLRTLVFHGHDPRFAATDGGSVADPEIAQEEFLAGSGRAPQGESNAV